MTNFTAPWPTTANGKPVELDEYDDDQDIDESDQIGIPAAYQHQTRDAKYETSHTVKHRA